MHSEEHCIGAKRSCASLQEMLAEAFALSGSFTKKGPEGHQDGPMLSPGRFLKLASLTEEGDQVQN